MKTKQMLSNISYNSIDFLKKKCDELRNNKKIEFYMFIYHKAENSINSEVHEKKNHIHLILFPSLPIDTFDLESEFCEYDLNNSKPLGVTKLWKTVAKHKELDWILYILHDPIYCAAKCMIKQYEYNPNEIISFDDDTKDNLVYDAYHETEFYHDKNIKELIINRGLSGHDLITNGYVPIKNACGYHHYLQMLKEG